MTCMPAIWAAKPIQRTHIYIVRVYLYECQCIETFSPEQVIMIINNSSDYALAMWPSTSHLTFLPEPRHGNAVINLRRAPTRVCFVKTVCVCVNCQTHSISSQLLKSSIAALAAPVVLPAGDIQYIHWRIHLTKCKQSSFIHRPQLNKPKEPRPSIGLAHVNDAKVPINHCGRPIRSPIIQSVPIPVTPTPGTSVLLLLPLL